MYQDFGIHAIVSLTFWREGDVTLRSGRMGPRASIIGVRGAQPPPPFHYMCMKHGILRASMRRKSQDGLSENFQPPLFVIKNGCGPITPVQ